jgi:hypothetical protein
VSFSVSVPRSLLERGLELPEELVLLVLGDAAVLQDVGDPLGDRDGRAELVGDVREEVGLGRRERVQPLGHLPERRLELGALGRFGDEAVGDLLADAVAERDVAVQHRPDGAQDRVGSVFLQQVRRGARVHHLRRRQRRRRVGPTDDGGLGNDRAEPPDEVGAREPLQPDLGDDDLGLRARGDLDGAEPVGHRLDREVRPRTQERVLELGERIGRIAQQDLGGHTPEVSAQG